MTTTAAIMAAIPALSKLIPGVGGGNTKVTQSTSLSQTTGLSFSLTNNTGGTGGGISATPQTITSTPTATATQTPDTTASQSLLPTLTSADAANNVLSGANSALGSLTSTGASIDPKMMLLVGGLVLVGVFLMAKKR